MYDPASRQFSNLAFLWPALAAASMSDIAAHMAKELAGLAVGPDAASAQEPRWATAHAVALELETVRLREFTTDAKCPATLLCAPFALHGAALADFAPHYSLVAALRRAGLRRLFVTDWRSANQQMRFLGIDDYLADLNVLVDEIGPPIDLVGLCQGGWMALIYAARFPTKVRKLVLAGAPVDTAAARSALSALADSSPAAIFHELVRLGDGIVPSRKILKFWGPDTVNAEDVRQLLQTPASISSATFTRLQKLFDNWYGWTLDLPGTFFLQVVEKLYKQNDLAAGKFVALGQRINLKTVKAPIFLLAAHNDELVAPPQLFAVEHLVGTPAQDIRRMVAPCRHVSLFLGRHTLEDVWPGIVRWMVVSSKAARRQVIEQEIERAH